MRRIFCFLVAILGISLFQLSAQADSVRNLNELKAQMTQLGKPALVIAGADWCVYCREMSQELATSPELQPLQKNFAILKIDVDTPVWDIAKRVFEFDGTGVPAVFVFRADGEKLYSASGKPSDMEGFLKRYLDKSGRILTTTEARDLSRDLTKIQGLLKKDDLAGAIEIAMPYEFKDCYAQTAKTMMDVKSQIEVLVTDQIAKLDEKLKETPVDFAAVVELVQLKQTCQTSRELLAKIQQVEETLTAEEANQTLIAQAEQLLSADQLREDRKRGEAADIYKELIQQYPDTAVAALAQERLGNRETTPAKPSMPAKTESGDPKKAAAYLRLAKQLLEIKSPKANEYLQKAIDEAPESEAAGEARELIK